MNKFILALFLLFLFTGIKAQSLEETKAWILSKLNKYQRENFGVKLKGDCDSYLQSYNYFSKFQKDTLIVTYDVKLIYPECFKGDKAKAVKETARKAVVKIPVSDITKVSASDEKRFSIHTGLQTIKLSATFKNGNTDSFTDVCSIGLNLKTEESLLERLQTAFNHLATFYPKKNRKETF
jgi:hypothetical protein